MIVDTRESKLAEALTELGVPFTLASLDVGDFLIQNAEGEPLLIAERKSHADLAASNTDGRYREQRARLMAVRGSGVAVLYILEGIWSATESRVYNKTTENQLKRLTTRLLLRYGMPVLAGNSVEDTARWCKVLLAQLSDDPTVFQPDSEEAAANAMSGFTAALHIAKKGNKTPTGTAQAMLSSVPGLGPKKVKMLLATKTLSELACLSVNEIAALGIGPKLAATIYEVFRANV
jgi:ERCC4-type nuclease